MIHDTFECVCVHMSSATIETLDFHFFIFIVLRVPVPHTCILILNLIRIYSVGVVHADSPVTVL